MTKKVLSSKGKMPYKCWKTSKSKCTQTRCVKFISVTYSNLWLKGSWKTIISTTSLLQCLTRKCRRNGARNNKRQKVDTQLTKNKQESLLPSGLGAFSKNVENSGWIKTFKEEEMWPDISPNKYWSNRRINYYYYHNHQHCQFTAAHHLIVQLWRSYSLASCFSIPTSS